jgi:hypothetical protein
MGRLKTKQWRSPVPQSEENFFLSVNYLTLLNRFLNDAALRVGGLECSSGECQYKHLKAGETRCHSF